MEEGQVTIDGTTYPLPPLFLVLATQNPIAQQGTYPLAEAQMDRFMMKLRIDYPDREEEREILEQVALSPIGDDGLPLVEQKETEAAPELVGGVTVGEAILKVRKELDDVVVDRKIQEYVVSLVFATREPVEAGIPELGNFLEFGTSPRATIFITRAARALAYLNGRDFVLPDDVKTVAYPVLRHRLRTTYEADAKGIDADQLIDRLLSTVPSP